MKKLEGVMKKGDAVMLSIAGTKAHVTDMAHWHGVVEGMDAYGRVLVRWNRNKTFSEWPEFLEKVVG